MAGKVEKYLFQKRDEFGALFFAVIDPLDYTDLECAVDSARQAYEAGSDMIVVGGSMGVQGSALETTVKEIKKAVDIPVTLFPGNIATVCKEADAIYFMSMLNSRNPYWITGAQMLAAPVIKLIGIEPLPVGYLMVGEGGTAAWVGDTKTIPPNKPKIAAASALAAKYMGFRFVFTDAGSNASVPVPPEIISAVREVIEEEIFYIVAGGIKTEQQARAAIKSGADAIQVGTALEKATAVSTKAESMIKAIREEGKKRKRRI